VVILKGQLSAVPVLRRRTDGSIGEEAIKGLECRYASLEQLVEKTVSVRLNNAYRPQVDALRPHGRCIPSPEGSINMAPLHPPVTPRWPRHPIIEVRATQE
jgi:hypothetical protein